MKLSTKGQYAVTAMMDLAINHSSGPMSLADISKNQNISLSYLEQIFSKLKLSGLVEGVRGPGGGYRLAKPVNQISIAAIILATDLPINNTQALEVESTPDDRGVTQKMWEELSTQLHDFLSAMMLSDFVKQPRTKHVHLPRDTDSSYINNMFLPVARAS